MKKIKELKKHEKIAILVFIFFIVVIIVLTVYSNMNKQADWLVYSDSLDEVAVVVNGENITLREIAFYIAYDESVVEEQAAIYDENNTERYWNVVTNGVFIRLLAKESTMDKIIHDEIFYQMALKDNVCLDESDADEIESAKLRFWNNVMFDDKLERLGVTENDLNATIEKIALAQKYQIIYANNHALSMEDFELGSVYYEKLLEENTIKIKARVWDRVNYGEVTLKHRTGVYNAKKIK